MKIRYVNCPTPLISNSVGDTLGKAETVKGRTIVRFGWGGCGHHQSRTKRDQVRSRSGVSTFDRQMSHEGLGFTT